MNFTLTLLLSLYVMSLATTMSGMELFGWGLALLGVVNHARLKRPFSLPPGWRSILFFMGVVALGILLGDADFNQKRYDLGRLRFYLLYASLFWTLQGVAFERWVRPLAVTCALVAVYGTIQHFMPLDLFRPEGKKVFLYAIAEEKIGPLVVGTFNHHLTFANIFFFYASVFTALGLIGMHRRSWALALGLWLFLLCVWTGSRIAWIATPVGLGLLFLARSWKGSVGILAAIAIFALAGYQWDPGFRERINRTWIHPTDFYKGEPRERLWEAQKAMFRDHPWIGVGWNNNERKAKEYVDRLYPNETNFYGHAHSTFYQLLASTGVLGCLGYLMIWIGMFWRLWGNFKKSQGDSRAIALGLLVGFIGFQIQGLTQWNFGDAEVLHNVIFFWAVTAAFPRS